MNVAALLAALRLFAWDVAHVSAHRAGAGLMAAGMAAFKVANKAQYRAKVASGDPHR